MEKGQKFKGVATIWQDGKVDFRPQAVGEPQRKGISETKNGKLYESIGKNPKLIAHVSIDAKTTDKSAALHEELEKLLPKEERVLPPPAGRRLLLDDDMNIVLDEQHGLLQVRMDIDVRQVRDLDSCVFNLLTRINTCLAFNKTLLKQQSRA
jgi:hypothetical protein